MEIPYSTEANSKEKSHATCPKCNKVLIQAFELIDGIIKCDKCHRRYLINISSGSVYIRLLNQPKEED